MKDYLNDINDLIPARREADEKAKLLDYVTAEIGAERVSKELLDNKHANIIIDNPAEARVIFTAHYDTPARAIIPNLMIPANKTIATLYGLAFPLALALTCLLVAYVFRLLLSLDDAGMILVYLLLYYGAFFLLTRFRKNLHNKNDNTSGVATIMSIASQCRDCRVAYILFDNEERGMLGSKAYNKNHAELLKDKLIINLDCVGNGDNFIFIPKKSAETRPEFEALKQVFSESGEFEIHYLPYDKAASNSDHKSFDNGIGLMACRKGKRVKFITDRIHTERDTLADSKNILFLTEKFKQFISSI